jgi:imidazolonepropionase-like amidohydrolase
LGGDFVKVVGLRNEEVFLATLAEAKKQGFGVAGHLEPTISAVKASNAGMTAIEHLGILSSVFFDCSSEEVEVRKEEAALPAMPPIMPITTAEARDQHAAASSPEVRPVPLEWLTASPMLFRPSAGPLVKRLFETYSEEKARTVARALVKNGTWNVPTLIRGRTMQFTDDPYYREHPDLRYLEAGRRAFWETIAQAYSQVVPPQANAAFRKFYELQAKTAAIFREEGVRMLAGTDLGGIWVVPGCSLHHEFRMLAEAGFSPLEILQMATLNGAEFLHREGTMGTVEEGKNADLVLLDANPIENVENFGNISGVLLKGRFYPQAALEKMKQDVEEACKA